MRRYFNTEGICEPSSHYMVQLDTRLDKIKRAYVDRGKYLTISRGRQYGKTTTLKALIKYLSPDYLVLFLDFQMLSSESFRNESVFSIAFAELLQKALQNSHLTQSEKCAQPIGQFFSFTQTNATISLRELFSHISLLCKTTPLPIVLIIDEADNASNNHVFIDFLSMLRGYYLDRENSPIFHSVILAGVYEIKNLKLKLRPEEEHQYNSPWNIAAKFNINMNFTTKEIAAMLQEYETDCHTGMDVPAVAKEIFLYTCGYPYLVSAICKILDEDLPELEPDFSSKCIWKKEGVTQAVHHLLKEDIPLLASMAKQLDSYAELHTMTEEILYEGKQIAYSQMEKSVNLGTMFGFFKENNGHVAIANRIFEMALLNMFAAKEAVSNEAYRYGQRDKNQFIQYGQLNMRLILEKFIEHFTDIYGNNDEKFIEKYGR